MEAMEQEHKTEVNKLLIFQIEELNEKIERLEAELRKLKGGN